MTENRPGQAAPLPHRRQVGGLLVGTGLVPASLTGVTLYGLGLMRGLPAWAALALAIAAVTLLVTGAWAILGRHRLGLGIGLWTCGLAAWAIVPTYFPGEREDALHSGAYSLALPLGDKAAEHLADSLAHFGRAMDASLSFLGPASPQAEPLPALDDVADDAIAEADKAMTAAIVDDATTGAGEASTAKTILTAEGEGRSLRVVVDIETDGKRLAVPLLFDTGATLTTLDEATMKRLGAEIPDDAPTAILQTAGGAIESPVVLLDRIWLGDIAIDRVSAAICESCSQQDARGLLGLNVTGLFEVTLRASDGEIILVPTDLGGDRRLDVGHWLTLGSTATIKWTGTVEVEVEVENSSDTPVGEVVTEVACVDRSFAIQIAGVPPRSREKAQASLPKGTDCSTYQVSLLSARWQTP